MSGRINLRLQNINVGEPSGLVVKCRALYQEVLVSKNIPQPMQDACTLQSTEKKIILFCHSV